jgi:hypothetical protein
MLNQIFEIIVSAASSGQAAIIISLAMNVALAWGWWRREQTHIVRYDTLRAEWIVRESEVMKCLKERDDETSAMNKEAFSVLQNVASAMAGMERTLEDVETLVQMSINQKINKGDGNEK